MWVVGADGKRKSYSIEAHEENMFYFNTDYRNRSFLDKDPIFGIDYDTYALYQIIRDYLEKNNLITSANDEEIRANVAAVILEIQWSIKKDTLTRKYFPWLK